LFRHASRRIEPRRSRRPLSPLIHRRLSASLEVSVITSGRVELGPIGPGSTKQGGPPASQLSLSSRREQGTHEHREHCEGYDQRWSYKPCLALPCKRGIADFWAVREERCLSSPSPRRDSHMFCCGQSAIAVGFGAISASNKFALLFWSSATSGATNSDYLCWAESRSHRKIVPQTLGTRMVNLDQL
jgi:hypothetical protein